MFLRYIVAVLMLSSISVYADNFDKAADILQKWQKREALKGEFSIVIEHVVGHELGDFWREKELPEELPQRGALYRVVTEHTQNSTNPNTDKLKYLLRTTLQHHRDLLKLFGNPKMNKSKIVKEIHKAFPELKQNNS